MGRGSGPRDLSTSHPRLTRIPFTAFSTISCGRCGKRIQILGRRPTLSTQKTEKFPLPRSARKKALGISSQAQTGTIGPAAAGNSGGSRACTHSSQRSRPSGHQGPEKSACLMSKVPVGAELAGMAGGKCGRSGRVWQDGDAVARSAGFSGRAGSRLSARAFFERARKARQNAFDRGAKPIMAWLRRAWARRTGAKDAAPLRPDAISGAGTGCCG